MSKPKVMILGSQGMLGHMVYKYFKSLDKYTLIRVARSGECEYSTDLIKDATLFTAIHKEQPEYIINCIGMLVKASEENPLNAIFINSMLPHLLEEWTKHSITKVIHISTDCVFSGSKGNYKEDDYTDGIGYYAKTKALGELRNNKDLTIRTSIIGPELKDGTGLMCWFMKQKGTVDGYLHAIWNGLTTLELAKQIERILSVPLTGLYQLTPDFNINKYELLQLIKKVYNKNDVEVKLKITSVVDKTLKNTRTQEYSPQIPSYEIQLKELKDFA